MKPTTLMFITLLAAPLLSQCIVLEPNGASPGTAAQLREPRSASTSGDSVIIREGGRVLSSFRTARPYIEETRWGDGQNRIVVKSRGKHGPATVQLFECHTGREVSRVMAYDIRRGQPAWAAGMDE